MNQRAVAALWVLASTFAFSLVFAALLGFMNQGETPGITTWLGSTLIVAGGLLLLRGGKKPA